MDQRKLAELKPGTVHEGEGNVRLAVITEINVWFHKILKGQFLFPFKVAQLIRFGGRNAHRGSSHSVCEDVICEGRIDQRPISCSEMFNFFVP